MDIEVEAKELSEKFPGRGRSTDTLTVTTGGLVQNKRLVEWRYGQVTFMPRLGFAALVSRITKRTLPTSILVFEDCDFSGMRTRWLEPGSARFMRCQFKDVRIRGGLLSAHFVDCTFSGTWEANFSAQADDWDPAPKADVRGNDFRGLSGMDFFDGVSFEENLFDLGGQHLILKRSDLERREVMSFVMRFDWAPGIVELLLNENTQSGHLLQKTVLGMTDSEWLQAKSLLVS